MARIKDSSVEAVKQTASIVDVISLRTPLRKVGGRYTGRCPFHEERTPSFSVNAEKGVYYCFGCGASGDTIKFVRETEQLDFVGAVEFLAERFNVPLEYDESSPQADADRKRRERLYALLEQATSFYERYLWDSEAGAPAREYLAGRGLGEEACREFRLGLAPLAPALARKAQEKGFTGAELAAAGLVGRRGTDYFSGRLLFPLADARGRVVGFQARKLRDDDPLKGKYVNTPEGELFHKGCASLRARQVTRGHREAGPRCRRRGEYRRARASPVGLRAGRRFDGDGAHGAATQGARAADATRLALFRRRCGGPGGDAPWNGARRQDGARGQGRRSGVGHRSRGRPGRFRGPPGRRPSPTRSTGFDWRSIARRTRSRRTSASSRS